MSLPQNFVQTTPAVPVTTGGKPFVATNRSGRITQQMFSEQIQDDVSRSLEGFVPVQRGSRTRPSLLKYPFEIGSGQFPHVMQFKVFWRWENRDLKESLKKAKVESEKKIGDLKTLSGLIENGQLTEENLMRSPLSDQGIAALNELVNDNTALKVVDPTLNDSLATMLQNNPDQAKQILEQTISSYQTRLSDINAEIKNGTGKVGPDEQERLQIQNRLSSQVENLSTGKAAATAAGTAGLATFLTSMFTGGGVKKSLGRAALAGGGAAAVTAIGVAGTKAISSEAVYDQMVSIYLPFCTKINNEDTFQYEDPGTALAGGAIDFLGNPLSTAEQGAELGINKLSEAARLGQAGAIAQGKVINPRLEKLFKQKDFRTFTFSWDFYPKTKDEVEQVRNIIETFRYHAHPAKDTDIGSSDASKVQVMLRVPGEFEVKFLSSNPNPASAGFVENEYLPKIGRCSLTSIAVDYTPNSLYSSFVDNSPTAVSFTLQFSEMGLLTREAIDKGY
jgi:hypothetical protein